MTTLAPQPERELTVDVAVTPVVHETPVVLTSLFHIAAVLVDLAEEVEAQVLVRPALVDLDQVRVVELAGDPGLVLEAPPRGARGRQVPGEHLERHVAAEVALPSEVDGAHATAPQLANDGVLADLGARFEPSRGRFWAVRHLAIITLAA